MNDVKTLNARVIFGGTVAIVGAGVSVGAASGNLLAGFAAAAAMFGGLGFIANTATLAALHIEQSVTESANCCRPDAKADKSPSVTLDNV